MIILTMSLTQRLLHFVRVQEVGPNITHELHVNRTLQRYPDNPP